MNDLINNRLFGLRIQNDTNLISLERILSIIYPSKRKYNKRVIICEKNKTTKNKVFYVDRLPLRHTKKEYITTLFKFFNSANLDFDYNIFKTGTETQRRAEFSRIYVYYRPIIMNYIMFQIGRDKIQVTEELTNNILLKISNVICNYNNDIAQFKTYIFTIVKNQLIDYYRSSKRKKIAETALIEDYVNSDGINTFDVVAPYENSTIFRTETMNKIMASIEKLKENERKVIELIVLYDLPQKKVAERLNLGEINVRVLYFRAKEKLQIMLKNECQMALEF